MGKIGCDTKDVRTMVRRAEAYHAPPTRHSMLEARRGVRQSLGSAATFLCAHPTNNAPLAAALVGRAFNSDCSCLFCACGCRVVARTCTCFCGVLANHIPAAMAGLCIDADTMALGGYNQPTSSPGRLPSLRLPR